MKTKTKTPAPVHSFVILPDGSVLPLPDCGRFAIQQSGQIVLYSRTKDSVPAAILPAGATLVTNWSHPNHA